MGAPGRCSGPFPNAVRLSPSLGVTKLAHVLSSLYSTSSIVRLGLWSSGLVRESRRFLMHLFFMRLSRTLSDSSEGHAISRSTCILAFLPSVPYLCLGNGLRILAGELGIFDTFGSPHSPRAFSSLYYFSHSSL